MAANYTENLHLPQWDALDPFKRTEFNEAFAAIDESCGALQSGAVHMATGSYTGTNTYGATNPNTLSFDFKPKVIVLRRVNSPFAPAYFYQGESAAWYGYVFNSGEKLTLNWSADGKTVSWYSAAGYDQQMNDSAQRYIYFAIG